MWKRQKYNITKNWKKKEGIRGEFSIDDSGPVLRVVSCIFLFLVFLLLAQKICYDLWGNDICRYTDRDCFSELFIDHSLFFDFLFLLFLFSCHESDIRIRLVDDDDEEEDRQRKKEVFCFQKEKIKLFL